MSVFQQIADLQLVKVRYRLEFLEPFHFSPELVMHWRKELVRGARLAPGSESGEGGLLDALINPAPAVDPLARKQFQKPSPPFIIDPVNLTDRSFDVGDILDLDVAFTGQGVQNAVDFSRILLGLGKIGFFKGEGSFELVSMQALTHHEGWTEFWSEGAGLDQVTISLLNLQWLVEGQLEFGQPLQMCFITPARLLKNNRPLFNADFAGIFPYLLRRVTSVLYAGYQRELRLDIEMLLAEASALRVEQNSLAWSDWRQLDAGHGIQGVGGISGVLVLAAGFSDDLYAILKLAELFHAGKSASYGAGCFVLNAQLGK